MWERTKRLINSYLDDMISRASGGDKEVRDMTRAEVARLNEVEVQARAAAKMMEKELAEVDLKITGAVEREKLLRESGDPLGAHSAANDVAALSARHDLILQQIREANSSATRARDLRDSRRRQGEELANETHLTGMRENLSGVMSPFAATDPASTIDEMRSRIGRSSPSAVDSRIAEADREIEEARSRQAVDDLLARYKDSAYGEPVQAQEPPEGEARPAAPALSDTDTDKESNQKTLGKSEGPIRPID